MDAGLMSPLGLYFHAGPVGKGVILLLLALSIWCWVLIVESVWSMRAIRRLVQPDAPPDEFRNILSAGHGAAAILLPGESVGERRSRIADAMHRLAGEYVERAGRALPALATIASVAPFIGLFGTVWGIMNSFIGIGAAQDTSLATVAPGIAEALAATAVGLAAAIPASVAYNRFTAVLGRLAQAVGRRIDEQAVSIAAPGFSGKREAA